MAEVKESAFLKDLTRNFKDLKKSIAESVSEDVEIIYRRKIEDILHTIRSYDRARENAILDLSPKSMISASVVPSDFKPEDFLKNDIEIGRNRRDAIINLEIVYNRYVELFGAFDGEKAVMAVLKPECKCSCEKEA